MSRIFKYTISTKIFFANYIYKYINCLFLNVVAISFSLVIALFVLQSLSLILLNVNDILLIRDIMLYLEFQTINTTINISLCNNVCYFGNATNVTNNLLQSFYILD